MSRSRTSVGSIIKEARRRQGLRVKDVAVKTSANISPSYLSCIENDLRLPSEELLLELADLLLLDRQDLYFRLVSAKAPPGMREQVLSRGPTAPANPAFDAVRDLTLSEVIERAAKSENDNQERDDLRRQLKRERAQKTVADSFVARWTQDADRYRMRIEKTVIVAELSLTGDVNLERHVLGLTPSPGKKPMVAIQHAARIVQASGTTEDDGFKLLEQPEDVVVEIERRRVSPERSLVRILFPDGLSHSDVCPRRVSYSLRSVMRGAYTMERPNPRRRENEDPFADADGRSNVIVHIDKPTDSLEVDVAFPRYYVPEDLEAWAGSQEYTETHDNFIDQGVCQSWELVSGNDYRVVLKIRHPSIGLKFGITWRPLYRDEFRKVQRRLQHETEMES